MVRPLRLEPNTGTVIAPKPALLRLFWWNLQPFAFPDAFDPLVVHMPAGQVEQTRDHSIPVASILAGEFDDVFGQLFFVRSAARNLTLRGTMLSQDTAGSAFRYAEALPHVIDAFASARRA